MYWVRKLLKKLLFSDHYHGTKVHRALGLFSECYTLFLHSIFTDYINMQNKSPTIAQIRLKTLFIPQSFQSLQKLFYVDL